MTTAPLIPAGAMVLSIVTALDAYGHTPPRAPQRRTSTLVGVLGDLTKFCAAFIGTERLVLSRHTVAPLLAAALPTGRLEDAVSGMLAGHEPRELIGGWKWVSPTVRRCPCCVNDDLRRYGFAFGRVIHQVQQLHTCPEHDVPLQQVCASCGEFFSDYKKLRRPYRILLSRCGVCGCSEGLNLSSTRAPIYERYAGLVAQLLRGGTPEVVADGANATISRYLFSLRAARVDPMVAFCEAWGAEDLAQAAARCSASPHQLRRVLTGKQPPDDVWVTLAVISVALAYLERLPRPRLGPPQEGSPISRILETDPFAQKILKLVQDFGLDYGSGVSLVRGRRPSKTRVPVSRLRCFMASLDASDRQELERRESAQRAGDACVGLSREVMRQFALAAKANGVHTLSALRLNNSYAAAWLYEHDCPWLQLTFAPSELQLLEASSCRARAIGRRDEGVMSQRQLALSEPRVFSWLRQHDRAWLELEFPPQRAWKDIDSEEARNMAEEMRNEGATTRKLLRDRDSMLYKWLSKNDPVYLDRFFPPWKRTSSGPERRAWKLQRRGSLRDWSNATPEVVRAVALELVGNAAGGRRIIASEDRGLYDWLRRLDSAWLDSTFPARRGRAKRMPRVPM